MSGEALYERYKDALKRGHVASLRGRLEEALTAYAEAATIAPERATPHASAGTALLRRDRPADALRHYRVALQLSPRDEAALLGRAEALAALGRRAEAGDAYDALAEVRASGGRLAEAVDAARRGLELAEGRDRRRTLGRLTERLGASELDEPARVALEQALKVLEGMAVAPAGGEPGRAPEAGVDGSVSPEAVAGAGQEVPPEPVRAALDRDLPAGLDPDAVARSVATAIDAGEMEAALELLLDLAAAHRRAGRLDAALDACYQGLSVAPDDVGLHLALVELYVERGWIPLATDKLDLLEQVATLDDDTEAVTRVVAARAAAARASAG